MVLRFLVVGERLCREKGWVGEGAMLVERPDRNDGMEHEMWMKGNRGAGISGIWDLAFGNGHHAYK